MAKSKPEIEPQELKPAIHALFDGLAPCGFSKQTPEHWPESQTWCNPFDVERITCDGCKAWSEKKLEEMRQPLA